MREAKNTKRAAVHVGYDGRVHKIFRGPKAEERFDTEVRVLKYLEQRGCDFVPRLLFSDPDSLKIITSNCGKVVSKISDEKLKALFDELETYGVRHDDPFVRNVTYRASDGRFCLIDFELATIIDEEDADAGASEQEKRSVSWTCRTDIGKRKNNEDVFVALALDAEGVQLLGDEGEATLQEQDAIFAVSDGVGGARSGEFASRTAIEKISRMLPPHFRLLSGDVDTHEHGFVGELFVAIHADLVTLSESYPECSGMGATLSLCWFTPKHVLIAHVGDSRVYRIRDGKFEQLTHDHTYVGFLRREGKINERQARAHPRRNVLSKSLGSGHQYVDPQVETFDCKPGDVFLVSDCGQRDRGRGASG